MFGCFSTSGSPFSFLCTGTPYSFPSIISLYSTDPQLAVTGQAILQCANRGSEEDHFKHGCKQWWVEKGNASKSKPLQGTFNLTKLIYTSKQSHSIKCISVNISCIIAGVKSLTDISVYLKLRHHVIRSSCFPSVSFYIARIIVVVRRGFNRQRQHAMGPAC